MASSVVASRLVVGSPPSPATKAMSWSADRLSPSAMARSTRMEGSCMPRSSWLM